MTNSNTIQILALCFLLSLPGLGSSSGLTLEQQAQARAIAITSPWLEPRLRSSPEAQIPGDTPVPSEHPLGRQILSIEKQENKQNPTASLVRVYEYDYPLQSTRMLVIELPTQVVVREQSINTVHLPLNSAEINFAGDLLATKSGLIDQLRSEQIRRGLAPFEAVGELDVKASIYEPMDPAHPCATQRCALLSLFDQTRTVFSIEPIVHLNSLTVDTLTTQ